MSGPTEIGRHEANNVSQSALSHAGLISIRSVGSPRKSPGVPMIRFLAIARIPHTRGQSPLVLLTGRKILQYSFRLPFLFCLHQIMHAIDICALKGVDTGGISSQSITYPDARPLPANRVPPTCIGAVSHFPARAASVAPPIIPVRFLGAGDSWRSPLASE